MTDSAPSPIRVTHLLAPVAFGGGEALLSTLIAAQRPDLVESMVTLGQAPLLEAVLDDSGTEHRALGKVEVGSQRKGQVPEMLDALPQVPALWRALDELQTDVVHAHGFPPSLLGALPLGRRVGRVYMHHYERQPPGAVETLGLTTMFDRYDVLTTPADHLTAAMNAHFPKLRRPFETLPIAVRGEFFAAAPSGTLRSRFGPDATIGVCVGRLVAGKNQRLILDALAELAPEDRHGIAIALVGAGPDEDGLRRLAALHGIEEHIAFVGQVPAPEMPGLLADADFGIFPTTSEASSVAAAEALATGLPLLALDITPMRETAQGAGTYVGPGSFARGILDVAQSYEARVPAARAAAERFRMATVREQWTAIYRRVSPTR